RLSYSLQFSEEAKSFLIPTMMVQTLVENGIKHGVSKLVDGGNISLFANVDEGDVLKIKIKNPGQLNFTAETEGGYGVKNTKQRLELLFGNEGKFDIYQSDNAVITVISLPKRKKEDNR
ncbi:MAG: histidine kinase, partial [Bacteroidota bacterium]